MLTKEDFAVIKALNHRGAFIKDFAAELGVHPKTVRRALVGDVVNGYDSADRLTSASLAGRKTGMHDPDMGKME